MTEWQPIETAPKDGRLILLFSDGRCHIARWESEGYFTGDPECRVAGEWQFDDDRFEFTEATHWHPLPDPPNCVS